VPPRSALTTHCQSVPCVKLHHLQKVSFCFALSFILSFRCGPLTSIKQGIGGTT